MSASDSDESVDQIEQFRNANVQPGMFVSGWEDPNDEIFPEENPKGECENFPLILNGYWSFPLLNRTFYSPRKPAKRDFMGNK